MNRFEKQTRDECSAKEHQQKNNSSSNNNYSSNASTAAGTNLSNDDEPAHDDSAIGHSNTITEVDSFDDLPVSYEVLRGIYSQGFEQPTPIQRKAILPFIQGHDLIAQAQSGTGKTVAFMLGALSRIDVEHLKMQALVVAPTRELAEQIFNVGAGLSKFLELRRSLILGGVRVDNSIVRANQQLVVGTPGRVMDLLQRRVLDPLDLQVVVLDEADELLRDGNQLKEQVHNCLKEVFNRVNSKDELQICLFSATFDPRIIRLAESFLRPDKMLKILVKKESLTLEGIQQFHIDCEKETWKFEVLTDIYENISINQAMIYCNTKARAEELQRKLTDNDFTVSMMHGGMDQQERTGVLDSFRSGQSRILVSTDLLARGIDVQAVSVVINYDLPYKIENYIHRVGRSGRHGRKGVAINLVTSADWGELDRISRFYGTEIREMPVDVQEYF